MRTVGKNKGSLVQRELDCEARLRDCSQRYLKKDNPSPPTAELPLHKGAFRVGSLLGGARKRDGRSLRDLNVRFALL